MPFVVSLSNHDPPFDGLRANERKPIFEAKGGCRMRKLVVMLVPLLVLALVLGGIGCAEEEEVTPTPTPTPTAQHWTWGGDPDELVPEPDATNPLSTSKPVMLVPSGAGLKVRSYSTRGGTGDYYYETASGKNGVLIVEGRIYIDSSFSSPTSQILVVFPDYTVERPESTDYDPGQGKARAYVYATLGQTFHLEIEAPESGFFFPPDIYYILPGCSLIEFENVPIGFGELIRLPDVMMVPGPKNGLWCFYAAS